MSWTSWSARLSSLALNLPKVLASHTNQSATCFKVALASSANIFILIGFRCQSCNFLFLGINGIIKSLGAVCLGSDVKVEPVAALYFRAVGTCQIVVFLPQVCHFRFRRLDLCIRFLLLSNDFLCLFLELFLLAFLLPDDEVVPFRMVNPCL